MYGENWVLAKEAFENSGLRFVQVDDINSFESGDIYNPETNEISKVNIDEAIGTEKSTDNENYVDSFINNKQVMLLTTINNGNNVLNYGTIKEPNINNFTSINPQILPNNSFICNEINKKNDKIFFNYIYLIDSKRNVQQKIFVPNLHHECIYGSNTPRYYTPAFDYDKKANTNFLYLERYLTQKKSICYYDFWDDRIVECDIKGNILWQWQAADHFDDFCFNKKQKEEIKKCNRVNTYIGEAAPYLRTNSVCCLGENKWYDAGDERFRPENLICSSKQHSMIWIIDKSTGKIVWLVKNDKFKSPFFRQHYVHMIPQGLQGTGNILLLDNGNDTRGFSRLLEFEPINLQIVHSFILPYNESTGSVQVLPNGNYLIALSKIGVILELSRNGLILKKQDLGYRFTRANYIPDEWNRFKKD